MEPVSPRQRRLIWGLPADYRNYTGRPKTDLSRRVSVRDNRTGPMDFTVAVTASLKAFPRFGLGTDRVKQSLLLGY